jgi:DNA primase
MKPLSVAAKRLLNDSAKSYHQQLRDAGPDSPAAHWFKERHLTWDTARRFRLGWVEEAHHPDHQQFAGRLVIPNIIKDPDGNDVVVGMKFRLLDHGGKEDTRAKFLYPQGQMNRLYNLRDVHDAGDTIVVTEGESDLWAACATGVYGIGVPGANNWGREHGYRARLLQGFSRVILLRDADEAGNALVKALEAVDGLEVRTPPDGFKDVGETFVGLGPEATRAWIEGDSNAE